MRRLRPRGRDKIERGKKRDTASEIQEYRQKATETGQSMRK